MDSFQDIASKSKEYITQRLAWPSASGNDWRVVHRWRRSSRRLCCFVLKPHFMCKHLIASNSQKTYVAANLPEPLSTTGSSSFPQVFSPTDLPRLPTVRWVRWLRCTAPVTWCVSCHWSPGVSWALRRRRQTLGGLLGKSWPSLLQ